MDLISYLQGYKKGKKEGGESPDLPKAEEASF